MIIARRKLLTGLIGLIAAPAIVKIEWIMPVKKIIEPPFIFYSSLYKREMTAAEFAQIVDPRLALPNWNFKNAIR